MRASPWPDNARRAARDGKTVVIDFGGPNIAKPMHVGHLRSSIIGDCLQRLYRANGWRVVSDVHLGDWGLQMGQLISEIEHRGIAPIYFDRQFQRSVPGTIAGDDGRSGRDLSGARRPPARPIRRGWKRRGARPWNCRPGGPAIARCGGISSRCRSAGWSANLAAWACGSICGRAKPASIALIAPMIEDLKARGLAVDERGRAGRAGGARRRQESRCRR